MRMVKRVPPLENSVLVVAHPDDEVLWFGSLLGKCEKVIFIFQNNHAEPGIGERRARALAELPFECMCLEIAEAGTYGLANWNRPQTSPHGIVLEREPLKADTSRVYKNNFDVIRARLKRYLSAEMNVFTHNPWGEYGHEDHVQVYRIVENLGVEVGFSLRVSSYFSARSTPLLQNYSDSGAVDPTLYQIDPRLVHHIAGIYKHHRCWTWANDWVWNQEECFLGRLVLRGPDSSLPSLAGSPLLRQIPSSVHERLPQNQIG